jgi:hypothetical protein
MGDELKITHSRCSDDLILQKLEALEQPKKTNLLNGLGWIGILIAALTFLGSYFINPNLDQKYQTKEKAEKMEAKITQNRETLIGISAGMTEIKNDMKDIKAMLERRQ